MTAIDEIDRILSKRARQIGTFKRGLVKSDQKQANAPANTLDNSVGGKRCRQRHHLDIIRCAVEIGKNFGNGTAKTNRQIIACGQRLASCQDNTAIDIKKRRISVGAASIKADYK